MKDSIPDSELEIMKLLWGNNAPMTAPEIVKNIRLTHAWKETTIQTLLTRLLKKGAVRQDGSKRSYQYFPLISQREYQQIACNHLIKQAFGGNIDNLMNFLLNSNLLVDDNRKKT